jgi:cytoskeletal protein RodZ
MSSLGSYLKQARELKQVSVAELAQTTRIPARILSQLEDDEYERLPADVFVRGFLRSYARSLDLDEEHVLARYGGRQVAEPVPSLPAAVYSPESGRRFGIAIALFILLVLFTLALSIVLRPRHRDVPVELSRATTTCPVEPTSPTHWSSAPSTMVTPTASSRC